MKMEVPIPTLAWGVRHSWIAAAMWYSCVLAVVSRGAGDGNDVSLSDIPPARFPQAEGSRAPPETLTPCEL